MIALLVTSVGLSLPIQPVIQQETKSAPDSWPMLLKESVTETGRQIELKNREHAWFFPVRKSRAMAEKEQINNGLLPDSLEVGTLIGCMVLDQNHGDFRGQTIPAGSYSLHFGLQPVSDDHAETAPTRHFAIFVPIESNHFDPKPNQEKLFKRSTMITSKHPVVMPILPGTQAKSLRIAQIQSGIWALEYAFPVETPAGMAVLPLKLVIAGKSTAAK